MKIQKKNIWGGGGVGVVGLGGGGQGGCERRIEVFVNIQKKIFSWGGGGNEELKFLGKFTKKKKKISVAEGVRWGGGSGCWGGGDQGGFERNVGGRGDVGYGGCEPRIEGIVQCTKRYCTILRK